MDIYVGNLSRVTTEESLRSLFEAYGTVASVKIMVDKFTGEPRGFGFVTMATDDEAHAAIAALNGRSVDGRSLRINQARPPEPREAGSSFRGGAGHNRDRGGGNDRMGSGGSYRGGGHNRY